MKIVAVLLIALLVCAVYLFAIMPNFPRRDMNPLLGRYYAHRGLWNDERPENSLSAFIAAREAGYGVELDVHRTADGGLVVHHDDSLQRMCGADIRIGASTLETVRSFHLKDTDELVPTFDEVLEAIGGKIPMIIELKTENNVNALCEAVWARMQAYDGPWCMESFDPRAVQWFRRHAPEVIRGQLAYGASLNTLLHEKDRLSRFFLLSQLGNVLGRPDFIAYDHSTDNNLPMRLVRLMKPHLVCWTVRSQEAMDVQMNRYDLQIFEGFLPKVN